MKKLLTTLLIAGLVTGAGIVSAKAGANSNEKERGYITISTSSDMELTPDVADISFAIVTSDSNSMQKATIANKEASDRVYNLLKSMLNTQNGDYIKTSDYNAQPVYVYSNNKKKLDKYEVSNRVTVHTKSLDKLGTMIDKSIEAGATNVNSLNFSVSNYESQCNSLIENASKKAYTRAQIAVKPTGSILDGIRSMDVSCSDNGSRVMPRVYMAKNMLSATADSVAAGPSTAISEGAVKIYANVNASFFVK